MDTVNALMDFEDGTLDDAGTLELFSHLITTGMAWNLQGSYGRMAQGLSTRATSTPTASSPTRATTPV